MRGNVFNYNIVNGQAPTNISDGEETDGFFDVLEMAYDISPRNYTKIVLGYFNAQMDE
jgi:hypothetical protein